MPTSLRGQIGQKYNLKKVRNIYSVKFAGAVYVLHTFQKKSKTGSKTPKQEIDLVKARLKAAEEHCKEWNAKQKKGTP